MVPHLKLSDLEFFNFTLMWKWHSKETSTLESPLDCKEIQSVNPKGNQSWIFIGRTEIEVLILWPLMWRADSLEKTLMLGKIEGRRRREQQRMRWLDGTIDSMDMSLSNLWEILKERKAWHATVHRVANNWTWIRDWTIISSFGKILSKCFL